MKDLHVIVVVERSEATEGLVSSRVAGGRGVSLSLFLSVASTFFNSAFLPALSLLVTTLTATIKPIVRKSIGNHRLSVEHSAGGAVLRRHISFWEASNLRFQ